MSNKSLVKLGWTSRVDIRPGLVGLTFILNHLIKPLTQLDLTRLSSRTIKLDLHHESTRLNLREWSKKKWNFNFFSNEF